jgi:hypothetical protein
MSTRATSSCGMWCVWLQYQPSVKDGSSCAHINHHLTFTWGRLWSSSLLGLASIALPPYIKDCSKIGVIYRLTTLLWYGEMGTYINTNHKSVYYPPSILYPFLCVQNPVHTITGYYATTSFLRYVAHYNRGFCLLSQGGVHSGSSDERQRA